MEANKEKKAKKDNIWTADANSDVSDSQLNDSNDSIKPKLSTNSLTFILNLVRLVYFYTQAQKHS
jgi:hypothetical protein